MESLAAKQNLASIKVARPPMLPIFLRTLSLLCALFLCMAGAFTWWSRGISWLHDKGSGIIPVLQCPDTIYSFQNIVPLGRYCQLSYTHYGGILDRFVDNNLFNKKDGNCLHPTDKEDPIICNLDAVCDTSVCVIEETGQPCQDFGRWDPIPVGETGPMCLVELGTNPETDQVIEESFPCQYILIGSYCDSGFHITSSNTLAMRGIVVGSLIIVLVWFIAEWILRSVEIEMRRERARGMARMEVELPKKRLILRQSLEQRWQQAGYESEQYSTGGTNYDFDARSEGSFRSSSFAGTSRPNEVYRRLNSVSWRRRIDQWQRLRNEKHTMFQTKVVLRSMLLNGFFFVLLIGTFYAIIAISPQNISIAQTWVESLMWKSNIASFSHWMDYLIFLDILVDTGLFLAATLAVKWPKPPLFSQHIQSEMEKVVEDFATNGYTPPARSELSYSQSGGDEFSDEGNHVDFILDQAVSSDTCLMIACHCSTMTEQRRNTFFNTLQAALTVFPPHHIFVCDNGTTIAPVDETQFVCKQVNPEINYLYVPEGNKTFAFYWCNKYWIPFLNRSGLVPNFTYALIIDDDVPLPKDLHIPHEHLMKDLRIKAVHFPITATTPDGNPPLLVNCQDIEYKLAGVHKLFQASMYRSLSCHGAIALWERGEMAEVLYAHDTVFNGEDLYMGLTLLRKRDDSKIISCAQTIVPTYAPDKFSTLFRQRVKSWELTSHKKTFTYLMELINPLSWFHIPSLCLKPYFLQETLNVLLDWLRIFLIAGLIMRDTLGFIIMTAFFTSVMYFQLMLLQLVVLRDRPDLRSSLWTLVAFPTYKFVGLFFRICALCQNILVYSKERKNLSIKFREDEIKDIPPLPPHHLVDWFTVWNGPEEEVVVPIKRAISSAQTPRRFR
jgi:hypothetical protein